MTTGTLYGQLADRVAGRPAETTQRTSVTPPQEPLGSIVEKHQSMIYGYLFARLQDHSDVDDLCQEVFLRFHQNRQPKKGTAEVGPWLVGIARNVLREHTRRIKRRREVSWTEVCLTLDELTPAAEPDVFGLADLPDCLESLGPSARQALELHYRDKLKYSEIAKRLSRSEGAVKLLLYRSRQALRHCIQTKQQAND